MVIFNFFEEQANESLNAFVALRVSVVMVCWIFVIVSVLIDFWSGISAARYLGERINSKGFRQSVEKVGDYFKILLFALMFDTLGSCFLEFYVAPFMTFLTTVAIMLIEGKSVLENCRKKRTGAVDATEVLKRILRTMVNRKIIIIVAVPTLLVLLLSNWSK